MGLSWYVLITEPRAEYLAASELNKDEFEVFFPRVKTPHHRAGHVDEPLFPGYLFLHVDPDAGRWPSFRPAHRLKGWVNFAGMVPSIPDETITELARRVDMLNASDGLWHRYQPGETVRVVSGNIDNLAQVVEEAKSPQGRARVLMEFMGRQIQAQVPWADLRPVEHGPNENQRPPRRTRGGGRWIRGFGPAASARAYT